MCVCCWVIICVAVKGHVLHATSRVMNIVLNAPESLYPTMFEHSRSDSHVNHMNSVSKGLRRVSESEALPKDSSASGQRSLNKP